MTAPVEVPVAPPVNPSSFNLISTPTDAEIPRMPAAELPEVLTNGFQRPVTNGRSTANGVVEDPFKLSSEYAYTPRKIKVITIGAGFSGLLMAHKFQHRFPEMRDIVEHKIFEARSEVGGTWFVNDYPGVQCDVPAHIYVSGLLNQGLELGGVGPDILAYIKATVKKWNLDRDLHLNTKVVDAIWQEDSGQWQVTVEHEGVRRVEHCHVLISAQGVLVHESWPEVPGLRDFKGHLTHSAAWEHNYDYAGKRIAVIGNGSSGIQIVPQMAKLPGTDVKNFIRGPAWVYYRAPPSKHLGRDDPDPNPRYTDDERKRFRDPDFHLQHRKGIISRTNKSFYIFIKGENNRQGMKMAAEQMADKLGHDPELCATLIPTWELGCRRITPGPGYLESFLRPNCSVTNSGITRVAENGVHTADGKFYECDVIVCATGFDVSHRPRYPVIGKSKIDLATRWAEEPDSYLSVAVPDFPNYFMMMGPNCLGGHGSLVESLNWTGDYFVKWIRKMATEDIRYVTPKQAVADAFMRYGDEVHKTLVWTGACKSWYKRNRVDGRVTALFGGSAHLFNRMLGDIRGEDFDVTYNTANPFRFMGNGFTEWEMDPKSDLSWYVEKAEVPYEEGGKSQ
ncbi:phenylacetone monooxygenase [Verticillium dahliae VdLs.17]|uniref:Phenylacetone monooxygenase n=1 Tax=Verticillium dahliae (strain VdLs.17 / ATCC MYA-4575 / FGSC 10137) TaxID=498257 RepID=G2X3U9_VERDV|nr:phenylacetone monooxygenase [Verticillium dahliae VdLs.17]EGY23248.1 phenylacetone monooxygenase [Verticillium dahliae VdLs.17]KAH6662466.1 phenylacetone monooxygenase [Verticillium dahliae]